MLRSLCLAAALTLVAGPAAAAPAPDPPADLSDVVFTNDTGMTILYLYIAACGESEGEDWNDMASWATDSLGSDVLPAGGEHAAELYDGCYVVEPHYENGMAVGEQVTVDGRTAVYLSLG